MEDADQAALELLADEALDPAIVEEVTRRAVKALLEQAPDDHAERDRVVRDLARLDVESERLTAAVAAGGNLAGLLEALRERDHLKATARARLADLDAAAKAAPLDPSVIEARVRQRLADWRGLLGRGASV